MTKRFLRNHEAFLHPLRGAVILCIAILSCSPPNPGSDKAGLPFKPTVILNGGADTPISDYQASVKVYYTNDRVPSRNRLSDQYRLSVKNIAGELNTRIDYPDMGDGPRSVILNKRETIIFNPRSGEVSARFATPNASSMEIEIPDGQALIGRVNIDGIIQKYRTSWASTFPQTRPTPTSS
jgi:hypothetical protein